MNSLNLGYSVLQSALEELKRRQNPDGGFAMTKGGISRPDATAWALLALRSCGQAEELTMPAGGYLRSFQLEDGRVVLAHDEPKVVWITYIAAWVWQDSLPFEEAQEKALDYILKNSGDWKYFQSWIIKHNLRLKGWSWIEGTSSWVDSTALALLALRAAGLRKHPRYLEGIKLLRDRELPSGGWNCGNTILFGRELRPNSESTGMAMALLSGEAERHLASAAQLRQLIRPEAGPLSLAWALLSMGTQKDLSVLEQALALQEEKGFCQTEWLSLLCMAWPVMSNDPVAAFLGFWEPTT